MLQSVWQQYHQFTTENSYVAVSFLSGTRRLQRSSCVTVNTRRTTLSPCASSRHTATNSFSVCCGSNTAKRFTCTLRRRWLYLFVVCKMRTCGDYTYLSCVFLWHTAKSSKNLVIYVKSCSNHQPPLHMELLVIYVKIWNIFAFVCYN
jgi:hypothetical protein